MEQQLTDGRIEEETAETTTDTANANNIITNDVTNTNITRTIYIPDEPDVSAQERVQMATNFDTELSFDVTCQVEIQFPTNFNHGHIDTSRSSSFRKSNKKTQGSNIDDQILLYCRDCHGRRKKRKTKLTTRDDYTYDDEEEFYIRYEEYIEEESNRNTDDVDDEMKIDHSDTKDDGHDRDDKEMCPKDDSTVKNQQQNSNRCRLLLQAVAIISSAHSLINNANNDDDLESDEPQDLCYILDFVETPMSPSRQSRPLTGGSVDGYNPRHSDHSSDSSNNTEDLVTKGKAKHIFSVLTVYFEYSNGIGLMPPPHKSEWDDGGYTHTQYTFTFGRRRVTVDQPDEGTISALNTATMTPTTSNHCRRPFPIRPFRPPDPSINLRQYDRVLLFGDSTFCQFCRQRPNIKGKYYFQHNLMAAEKVRLALNTNTVSQLLKSLHEELGPLLLEASVNNKDQKKKTTALIVGSCLWDILDSQDTTQGRDFDDHAVACRQSIIMIRQMYPNVTLIWKSPYAVHIHRVDLDRITEHDKATATLFGRDRIRYMSRSRSKHLYELQKRIMMEMDVPFIDLYQATHLSADWLYPSDGRHYRPVLNRLMLSWYYPPDTVQQEQQCRYYQQVQ